MRFLHTSDWHLGRKLYDRPRISEQKQFLDWLLQTIIEQRIDVLLCAGDVFDSSIPPAQVMDLYYHFLFRLYQETSTTAVIIAGNHDSAVRLAAPREFLKLARMHVIGNIAEDKKQVVVPVKKNGTEVNIIALPYVPEGEILSHVSFESQVDSAKRYREAIKILYREAINDLPHEIPIIIMGHYFLSGSQTSESEQIIQVGGSNPLTLDDLPAEAGYVALGHLHRPQQFAREGTPIIYSGSPIPMTFKEARHEKNIFLFDLVADNSFEVHPITVPVFRALVQVTGTFDQIMHEAESGDWEGKLIEVIIDLDIPRIGISDQIRKAFSEKGGEVATVQTQLLHQQDESRLSAEEVTARSPEEIFRQFYIEQYGDPDDDATRAALSAIEKTFSELMDLRHKNKIIEAGE
ncbi:exonuclease SbcCD subunit D C-terminal domain-containing protein [candidate division KSB1 bacterium]|nr:exonuclease SbcCD subunit D C-terminal domain-containing protein [candidate division KSB1 bacterium]